jgi:hypothetical protein
MALTIKHPKRSAALTAQVRQATLQPDGQWILGCCFSRLLDADDILRLGA